MEELHKKYRNSVFKIIKLNLFVIYVKRKENLGMEFIAVKKINNIMYIYNVLDLIMMSTVDGIFKQNNQSLNMMQ